MPLIKVWYKKELHNPNHTINKTRLKLFKVRHLEETFEIDFDEKSAINNDFKKT